MRDLFARGSPRWSIEHAQRYVRPQLHSHLSRYFLDDGSLPSLARLDGYHSDDAAGVESSNELTYPLRKCIERIDDLRSICKRPALNAFLARLADSDPYRWSLAIIRRYIDGRLESSVEEFYRRSSPVECAATDVAVRLKDPPAQNRDSEGAVEWEVEWLLHEALGDDRRRKDIIRRYYGLIGGSLTLAEVGEQWGVTRERIRQLRNESLERIESVSRQIPSRCVEVASDVVAELGGIALLEEVLWLVDDRLGWGDEINARRTLDFLASHTAERIPEECIEVLDDDLVCLSSIGSQRLKGALESMGECRRELTDPSGAHLIECVFDYTPWLITEDINVQRRILILLHRRVCYEPLPGFFSTRRWSHLDWAHVILAQSDEPMHYETLSSRIYELTGQSLSATSLNGRLNSSQDFVRVGAGTFLRSVDGPDPYSRFDEVIVRELGKVQEPIRADDLFDQLEVAYDVARSTMRSMLHVAAANGSIAHYGGDHWGPPNLEEYEVLEEPGQTADAIMEMLYKLS